MAQSAASGVTFTRRNNWFALEDVHELLNEGKLCHGRWLLERSCF